MKIKEILKGKGWLLGCAAALVVCAVLLCFAPGVERSTLGRDRDTQFVNGSGIVIEQADALQKESLYKLAKVWGYVKYRHPDIVAGQIDWDAELFRVMPDLLAAQTADEANAVLAAWLDSFPFEDAPAGQADTWLAMQGEYGTATADLAWTDDASFLGAEVCRYLQRLSCTFASDWSNGYAATGPAGLDFTHEKNIPLDPADDGVKLLAAFRFWNAYEYFSPHVDITRIDWDDALLQSIDDMLAAGTWREYMLALGALTAATGDAHVQLQDSEMTLQRFYGSYFLPCTFLTVDGQVTVRQVGEGAGDLRPGDVLLAIDGVTVADRIAELGRYFPLPQQDKIVNQLRAALLSTAGNTARVTVRRDGQELTLTVPARQQWYDPANPLETGLMEGGRIGYIDPSALEQGELETRMKEFAATDGIIVDLRRYPSVFLTYLLAEYINPEPTQFAVMTVPSPATPGVFYLMENFYSGAGCLEQRGDPVPETLSPYPGKVVLLMDETSQSQSEFTVMSLRQAPNALVVGSASIGADGNVATLPLPGGCSTGFTSMGVFTPDGQPTQRVGLTPDVWCLPTVEGLRDGRDELLETAVELILQS